MFSRWFGFCAPQRGCSDCETVGRQGDQVEAPVARRPGGPEGGRPLAVLEVDGRMGLPTLHSETRALRVPSSQGAGPRLSTPPIFSRFQFSVIYTQLGATQGTLMEQQRNMLQAILRHFTKELSHGSVVMGILDADGRAVDYACSLDPELTHLAMQPVAAHAPKAGSSAVSVADAGGGLAAASALGDPRDRQVLVFREIERVCSPEEVRNLCFANILVLDECCTTVVLAGQRFVTFRLDSVPAREYLMLCLQVLRMSQEKARMWYQ